MNELIEIDMCGSKTNWLIYSILKDSVWISTDKESVTYD